jgi:hypothetical protein
VLCKQDKKQTDESDRDAAALTVLRLCQANFHILFGHRPQRIEATEEGAAGALQKGAQAIGKSRSGLSDRGSSSQPDYENAPTQHTGDGLPCMPIAVCVLF